eukprot:10177231-Heterocapsa_arctica.AAC.1
MFLNAATRPRWQAGEGGAVQEQEQAAAYEPEALVRLEAAVDIMRIEEQATACLEKEVKAAAGEH